MFAAATANLVAPRPQHHIIPLHCPAPHRPALPALPPAIAGLPGWVQEITRRVNLHDIWQAVYTAGVLLPKPVAECQYWHRSLNPKKLINIGFRCAAAAAVQVQWPVSRAAGRQRCGCYKQLTLLL